MDEKEQAEWDKLVAIAERLETLCRKAYQLYVDGRAAEAMALTEPVVEREFTGEYETWTWVQAILALRARIGADNGSDAEAELYRRKQLAAVETGDESKVRIKRRVHARFLGGAQLDFDKVQAAIDDGDRESELGWRLVHLIHQIELEPFLADPASARPGVIMPTVEALRTAIDANIKAMRALEGAV